MDFSDCKTAEDVFRLAKQEDPKRWALLVEKYPVADSPDDDYRHAKGERRPHRNKGVAKRVPKEHQRPFTAAEWAALKQARQEELREMRLTYSLANELAQEGF